MVFIDLATGFFRRNARSGGVAEGGCGGEFRRARAFRRSEAEAVSFVQNRFGLCRIIAPISNFPIFARPIRPRTARLAKRRFEIPCDFKYLLCPIKI